MREICRVVYIRCKPEWFAHNVNDMFFRLPKWLFVPVQDLSSEDRMKEYERATYFFVSGYGESEEALKAYRAGCILVGVRADVPVHTPIIRCSEWDPTDAYITLLFVDWLRNFFPLVLKSHTVNLAKFFLVFFLVILRPVFKIFYLVRASIVTWKTQGLKYVLIKTRNYFRKAMHI